MTNSPIRRILVSLICLSSAFVFSETAFAAQSIFAPDASTTSKNAPRSKFDIKSKATSILLSRELMNDLKGNEEHEFVFPNETRHVVVFDRIEDHGGGIRSSVGYLKEHGKDYRVIITTGPGGAFGSIRTPETLYRIVPGLDGQDLLVDMTEEQKLIPYIDLGNDSRRAPPPEPSIKNGSEKNITTSVETKLPDSIVALAAPTPQATIDLMVVYTNGLAARLGSGLMTRLYNLVTAANTAYIDSEVAITLRLVNATMANYNDIDGNGTALDAITPSGGVNAAFTNIEAIRTSVGADMVALLRAGGDNNGSGIAWLTTSATPNAGFMYSVTTGCVVGCDSVFIHELGHNMGNAHDKATAAYQDGGTPTPDSGAFPYSFGHFFCASGVLTCNPFVLGGCITQPTCTTNNSNNVGTIMSYFNPVTLKFSNPNLMCAPAGGGATLQPCGVANQEDNARSMNDMRFALQNIKATVVATLPGAIQLAQSSYSFSEMAGVVNIAVSRVGGASGAVSVSYSTSDGSAKAGFDYLPASGMLTWADGDATVKFIPVTLINDGVTEGGETFNVSIANPTGAPGIFIGLPTSAPVQIAESTTWPPGGLTPAGFNATAGNSAPWAVASDSTFEGGFSLKSGAIANLGASSFSAIEFTGSFQAGFVTFAYRVYSFPNFGPFEFSIDQGLPGAVVALTDSGNTGWKTFSYAISAGTHTLRWKQTNVLGFPCSLAFNMSNPQDMNCQDRAWIDAVSLPLTIAGSSTALVSTANPSTTGQSVTFTATVTGGAGTPTGAVTFRDAGNIITMPNNCNLVVMSGGSASCTTNALSTGAHAITAAYSGNSTYDVSTSATLMQNVNGIALMVTKAGTGGGNVVSNPAGIDTAINNNSAGFATNTVVTLTQTPSIGSVFAGWSGACSGTGTCMVTMDVAKSVTATFNAFCTAGTFSMTGFAPCTPASMGNFVAGVGAMAQSQCLAGAYQPNTGATSCLLASPGSFVANAGSANQTACSLGTYQPSSSATVCLQAAPGNFVGMTGAIAQTACSPGAYQSLAAQASCVLASPGSFVAGSGATMQSPCVAGTFQSMGGAIACTPASAGSFVAMAGAIAQTQCLVGTYQPMPGAASCLLASPGNFVSITGAIAQTACSPGTYQSAMAATACLQASPGSFVSIPQATAQIACSPGSYQDLPSQTSCKLAQPGFFVAGGGAIQQTACPMGTTSIGTGNIACVSILPSAPTMVIATPGNAQASIAFAVPASNGGSPILDYTVTCIGPNTVSPVGTFSPIIATGLTNGQNYSCSVTARNANGSGPASSPPMNVMPSAMAPIALNSVVSRRNHPGLGDQDIGIIASTPLAGLVDVEPRTIGAGHQIVFRFNNTVTSVASSATTLGSVSHAINGGNTSEVIVTLTGIADNRRATVSLAGVNGTLNPSASIGFLVGDVTNSRSVNASDISAVKAHNGIAVSPTNYRFDLNVTGTINGTDVSAVKARSGLMIP